MKEGYDVRFQVNLSTFLGKAGLAEKRFLRLLIRNHWLDAVATDAHNLTTRKIRMAEGWEPLMKWCGAEYARELINGSVLE